MHHAASRGGPATRVPPSIEARSFMEASPTPGRRSRSAIRVVAGARILSALISLPAFFIDVAPAIMLLVGLFLLLTITSLVLMLSPARQPALVTD